jgi:hypothetical protein
VIIDMEPGTIYMLPEGRKKKEWFARVVDGIWNVFVVLDNDEIIQARIAERTEK